MTSEIVMYPGCNLECTRSQVGGIARRAMPGVGHVTAVAGPRDSLTTTGSEVPFRGSLGPRRPAAAKTSRSSTPPRSWRSLTAAAALGPGARHRPQGEPSYSCAVALYVIG